MKKNKNYIFYNKKYLKLKIQEKKIINWMDLLRLFFQI